jgi:hypothetical protein
MSTGARIGAVVLAVLLVATTAGANVATTTQGTALNEEFVITQMDEAGVYEELSDRVREEVVEDLENASIERSEEVPPEVTVGEIDAEAVAEDAVTEEFIQTRFQENIREVFAYLHGESETLNLSIDVEPVKEEIGVAIADQTVDVEAEQLIDRGSAGMGDTPVPISGSDAERMLESEEQYNQVTENFREDFQRQSGTSGEELDAALSAANQETKNEVENNTEDQTSEYSDNVTEATTQMQFAMVDALTDESVTYEQFTDRVEAQEQALGEEAGRLAVQQIDDRINDRLSLSDYMGSDTQEQIEDAPGPVQQIDTMAFVLPVLSLLFVGLIYVLTRSVRSTAFYTGVSLVVSALIGLLIAVVLRGTVLSEVRSALPADQPDAIGDAVLGLIRGILGTLSAQSLTLLVVGVLLVGLAIADSRGYLDEVKQRVADLR